MNVSDFNSTYTDFTLVPRLSLRSSSSSNGNYCLWEFCPKLNTYCPCLLPIRRNFQESEIRATDWEYFFRSIGKHILVYESVDWPSYYSANTTEEIGVACIDILKRSNTINLSCMKPLTLASPLIDKPESFEKDVDECFQRNTHGFPKETIQRMLDRFESKEMIDEKIANY